MVLKNKTIIRIILFIVQTLIFSIVISPDAQHRKRWIIYHLLGVCSEQYIGFCLFLFCHYRYQVYFILFAIVNGSMRYVLCLYRATLIFYLFLFKFSDCLIGVIIYFSVNCLKVCWVKSYNMNIWVKLLCKFCSKWDFLGSFLRIIYWQYYIFNFFRWFKSVS